ncbi:MAG: DUF1016 N-terminal domain-containing protein [Candidatus Omnitrophota bacterium]|jgi:endonuclease YncB( thermonuclease family)
MKKAITLGSFLMLTLAAPVMLYAEAPNTAPASVPSEQVRHSDDLGQSSTVTEVKTYEELRHAISQTRAASRIRVEKAVEQERVREAWEIGRLIDAHVFQHKERADYGEKVLERLATDLGMSRTELSYMLQFARTYPIYRTSDELTWGHYESLLALNDVQEREEVAARASKEKWPVKKLREEVKKRKAAKNGTQASEKEIKLTAEPGKPGTYKIILAQTGPYAGELAIDLGFSNYIELAKVVEDVSPFKEGEVLGFSDEQDEVRKSKEADLYTYQAWVHRVLDGDTVEAVVDLGFGITTTQTLRLRGIDAPEIATADGMKAKEFLESVIASPVGAKQSQDDEIATSSRQPAKLLAMTAKFPILIKTVKSDKYDRYLADVFVESVYINQKLIDEGLAVRVQS